MRRAAVGLRWGSTLALVESVGGKVTPASFAALRAAQEMGEPITALCLGPQAQSQAEALQGTAGVTKILTQASADFEHVLPERLAPLLVDTIKANSFTALVGPGSAMARAALPRAAALLDVQPLSDVTAVVNAADRVFERPTYAGNAILTVKVKEPLLVATVRGSAFGAPDKDASEAPIEALAESASSSTTTWVSEELVVSDKPDLGSARVVVSGGRPLKDKATFESVLNPLAEKLGAAVGASRVAVDEGYCDSSLQVGQTGKIVAPDLYVAVGIAGAIQHLAGMKDSKVIVAINKDEEAPIFKMADVGLVADIYEAVPELTEKL